MSFHAPGTINVSTLNGGKSPAMRSPAITKWDRVDSRKIYATAGRIIMAVIESARVKVLQELMAPKTTPADCVRMIKRKENPKNKYGRYPVRIIQVMMI